MKPAYKNRIPKGMAWSFEPAAIGYGPAPRGEMIWDF